MNELQVSSDDCIFKEEHEIEFRFSPGLLVGIERFFDLGNKRF